MPQGGCAEEVCHSTCTAWHCVRLGANIASVARCCLQALCLDTHKQMDTSQPFASPPALPVPLSQAHITVVSVIDTLSLPLTGLSWMKAVLILSWDAFLLSQRMQLAGKPLAPGRTASKVGLLVRSVFLQTRALMPTTFCARCQLPPIPRDLTLQRGGQA